MDSSASSLMLVISVVAITTGCRSTPPHGMMASSAVAGPVDGITNTTPAPGEWHSIEKTPRSDTPDIESLYKMNPVWWFMNSDDPSPPEWFYPEGKRREFKWFLRNPLHNFSFYVIGIADKPFVRSGRYPEKVSNPNGGWNFAVSKYKWLRLPYISYWRGRFEFYAGWRNRGNFGLKLSLNRADESNDKPGESRAKDAKVAKN